MIENFQTITNVTIINITTHLLLICGSFEKRLSAFTHPVIGVAAVTEPDGYFNEQSLTELMQAAIFSLHIVRNQGLVTLTSEDPNFKIDLATLGSTLGFSRELSCRGNSHATKHLPAQKPLCPPRPDQTHRYYRQWARLDYQDARLNTEHLFSQAHSHTHYTHSHIRYT